MALNDTSDGFVLFMLMCTILGAGSRESDKVKPNFSCPESRHPGSLRSWPPGYRIYRLMDGLAQGHDTSGLQAFHVEVRQCATIRATSTSVA